MVTPVSFGVGGTHRCSRPGRPISRRNQLSSKCSSSRMLASALSPRPPVKTKTVALRGLDVVREHVHQRVLEHHLRRRRLVEAILRVVLVLDVLDAQHRVRIPHVLVCDRLAEDADQRRLVRLVQDVALPVGEVAVDMHRAVLAEHEDRLERGVISDWWRGRCCRRRSRPCSGLRSTARSSRPASRRSPNRRCRASRRRCRCSRAAPCAPPSQR